MNEVEDTSLILLQQSPLLCRETYSRRTYSRETYRSFTKLLATSLIS